MATRIKKHYHTADKVWSIDLEDDNTWTLSSNDVEVSNGILSAGGFATSKDAMKAMSEIIAGTFDLNNGYDDGESAAISDARNSAMFDAGYAGII